MLLTIEKVAILKSVNIFAETPDHVLASVATIVEEVDLEPGETFITEGDLGDCMYIIIEGEVRVHSGEQGAAQLKRPTGGTNRQRCSVPVTAGRFEAVIGLRPRTHRDHGDRTHVQESSAVGIVPVQDGHSIL